MQQRLTTGLLLVLALAASAAFGAFAKIPYLQSLTDSTIIVHWETSTSQNGKVQYGLTTAYGSEVSQSGSTTDHELTLTGLTLDTVYHYRAISGSDTSADASFRSNVTGDRPFRFFAFGDNRSDSASHQSVVNRMLAQSPMASLAVNVGDLTYDGSTPVFTTFFNVEKDLMSKLPLYPAIGNHDASNIGNWQKYFALPNNERWYSFRYGNSAFISLDVYSTYTSGSAQYNWLVSELQADSADPMVKHIFVFFHDPPYTTNTGHSSNTTVRTHLCPLFERFHVAIAFQGHNHCYEHALVNDVHYILTGGGGAPLHTSWNSAQPWDVYREATFEFVVVSVHGDTIRAEGIRPDGTRFDSLVLVPTGVEEGSRFHVPGPGAGVRLSSALNPSTRRVQYEFSLSQPGQVDLLLYDPAGRRVAKLAQGHYDAGSHSGSWDGAQLQPGTYSLVLESGGMVSTQRLVIVGKD